MESRDIGGWVGLFRYRVRMCSCLGRRVHMLVLVHWGSRDIGGWVGLFRNGLRVLAAIS